MSMDTNPEAYKDLSSKHRLIDLTLRTHNYKLVNPYQETPQIQQNDHPRGYGLQNVRRCVDSYNGILDISQKDGFFTVSAHLNRK